MKLPDRILFFGSLTTVFAATLAVVIWPMATIPNKPSEAWRQESSLELRGRQIYINNGCTYCHSQYIRPLDWGVGAERIAKTGDYFEQRPHLLGSERTGPDLSEEGGEHSDDWQIAHFTDPRWTRPRSLMPRFAFVGRRDVNALVAYVQSLGGKNADARMAVQRRFHREAVAAYRRGPDANIEWLHSRVPPAWRPMPTESPVTPASLARGEKIYQDFCVGCHGPVGDGNGPAAAHLYPRPLNFTTLKRHLIDGKYIGGILYYQIMNGITGTAMPYHKKDLESAKIWDVTNFVMYSFINTRDDIYPQDAIPTSFEGKSARPVTVPEPGPIPPGKGAVR